MEHPGPVVPVGEHPLVRPAIAHHVVQAERLQLGQRRPLGRRDMGLADIGLGIEHVVVGRGDVHVAAHDRGLRAGGDHLPQRRQPGELVLVVLGVRRRARWARTPRPPGSRRRSRTPRAPPDAGNRAHRGSRPRRRPARRARGSRPRSTPPRRGVRRRSRGLASSSPSRSTNPSSASLVSCRQTTSGWRSSSQGSSRGRRCLTELTFQVAIRIGSTVARRSSATRAPSRRELVSSRRPSVLDAPGAHGHWIW